MEAETLTLLSASSGIGAGSNGSGSDLTMLGISSRASLPSMSLGYKTEEVLNRLNGGLSEQKSKELLTNVRNLMNYFTKLQEPYLIVSNSKSFDSFKLMFSYAKSFVKKLNKNKTNLRSVLVVFSEAEFVKVVVSLFEYFRKELGLFVQIKKQQGAVATLNGAQTTMGAHDHGVDELNHSVDSSIEIYNFLNIAIQFVWFLSNFSTQFRQVITITIAITITIIIKIIASSLFVFNN
jgi:hypothetical protein